jgi:hypothetical protein
MLYFFAGLLGTLPQLDLQVVLLNDSLVIYD